MAADGRASQGVGVSEIRAGIELAFDHQAREADALRPQHGEMEIRHGRHPPPSVAAMAFWKRTSRERPRPATSGVFASSLNRIEIGRLLLP